MKKFLKLSAIALAISSISSAQAATTSGTANARVVTPIAISQTTPLEFGSFSSSASLGTITQAGVVTGGVTAISGGATRTAGVFAVTGEAAAGTTPYTFTLPANVTLNSGGNSMVATLSFASGTSSRTLNSSGSDTVNVNGSLAVAANQAAGAYTGTYSVTVNY
jgi:hypothetical protein